RVSCRSQSRIYEPLHDRHLYGHRLTNSADYSVRIARDPLTIRTALEVDCRIGVLILGCLHHPFWAIGRLSGSNRSKTPWVSKEKSASVCAGINRHEGEDERALRERS